MNDGYVLAFKLGGKAAMPRIAEKNATIPEPPQVEATAAQLENGKYAYMRTCMVCHGALVVSGGVVPDLRMLTAEKHSIFKEIVYDGVIHGAGMPRLGDLRHRAGRARHPRLRDLAGEPGPGAAAPDSVKRETDSVERARSLHAPLRGSDIDANGVPNVLAVRLLTPVTYWSSSRLVTNAASAPAVGRARPGEPHVEPLLRLAHRRSSG